MSSICQYPSHIKRDSACALQYYLRTWHFDGTPCMQGVTPCMQRTSCYDGMGVLRVQMTASDGHAYTPGNMQKQNAAHALRHCEQMYNAPYRGAVYACSALLVTLGCLHTRSPPIDDRWTHMV
jgi:hypothetical protein